MLRPPDAKNGAAPGKAAPASISPAKALDASTVQPAADVVTPWPLYDVADLGLAPHPRETCAACQAVGA